MILKGAYMYQDVPVGVICLEAYFPKPLGHVRNLKTFSFPTAHKVVKGVNVPKLLFDPTPDLLEPFLAAAKELEHEGVKAITGSCGFLARFQNEIAEAVNIPVFMSSLLQCPLVRMAHGPSAKIGILTASSNALTPAHFAPTGAKIDDFIIKGMDAYPEFRECILECKRNDFDMDKLEAEILDSAEKMMETHQLDALILECTDLTAFGEKIQKRLGIPVYDLNGLVEYAALAVDRKKYL